jgi:hypothetical protein
MVVVMTKRGRRRPSIGAALVAVLAVLLACGSVPDDEFLCEEAVARLEDCCTGFQPRRFNCENVRGCNSNRVPAVNERASECIRDRGCADLESTGVCASLTRLSNQPYPSSLIAEIEREACR